MAIIFEYDFLYARNLEGISRLVIPFQLIPFYARSADFTVKDQTAQKNMN